MTTEITTSSSSLAVESARLVAVVPALSPDEPAKPDKAQREVIAQMVCQARDAGIVPCGPDGLLKALTVQVSKQLTTRNSTSTWAMTSTTRSAGVAVTPATGASSLSW